MGLLNQKDVMLATTIFDAVLHACRRLPDKAAFIARGGEGESYTYREIGELIGKIAGGLHQRGYKKADRVAVISENCPEWGITYLAAMAAGCIVVPLDASLKPNELARFLRVSKVRTVFCSPRWEHDTGEVIALNDLPIDVFTMVFEDGCTLKSLTDSEPYIADNVDIEDTAVIIYTSGTTGDPKGVVLTHHNILANIESYVNSLMMSQDDIFLSVLPLHHTFEASVGFLFPACAGLTVIYARTLKSRDILTDIMNNKVTVLVGVPLLYEKIFNAMNKKIKALPAVKKASFKALYAACKVAWRFKRRAGIRLFRELREKPGLGSIRMMVCGGAPLPHQVAEWFNMIGFIFIGAYGLTECSPGVSFNRPDDINFFSVGAPLPGVEVEIDRPAPDGIGEIKVRGKNNTPGYIDNPDATAELLKDGWLYTGYMGKIENGHIFITGRMKNLIVSGGGKNIYPEEIEAELNLSDYILESLVVGRRKEKKAGEDIWAIIVPDLEQIHLLDGIPEGEIPPRKIRDLIKAEVDTVNGHISDYKRITNFEIRLEEFDKTSTRKIKRRFYQ